MTRSMILVTITVLALLASRSALHADVPFGVIAATKQSVASFSRNFLVWPDAGSGEQAIENLVGYNLYRKIDPLAPYPKHPIHAQMIRPLTQCFQIVQTLGPDWKLVAEGLAAPPEDKPTEPPVVFDPCDLPEVSRGSQRFARLQMIARHRWRVAKAIGQGYVDANKIVGQTYYYELRAVIQRGGEVVLQSDVAVEAGKPAETPAPMGVQTHPEDHRILLTWNDQDAAAGFLVYRSVAPAGPYVKVHEHPVQARVDRDLFGDPIVPGDPDATRNGLVDFQHWNEQGDPVPHAVGAVNVDGPWNGAPYYYKVASVDLLGQQGPLSAPPADGMASDLTAPSQPSNVQLVVHNDSDEFEVRWVKVTRDVDGHPEMPGVTTYRVYRFDSGGNPYDPSSPDPENPDIGGTLIAELPAPPPGQKVMSVLDSDPILVPAYGERTFWYRVVCVDAAGKRSEPSGAAGGFLEDEIAPAPVLGTAAEGFDQHIRVTWNLSPEEDVDSYQVYRSLCDEGVWACEKYDDAARSRCPNVWVLVGTVHHVDFVEEGDPSPFLEDTTVPDGSPLCYAYLVKALDESQNASGCWPPCPVSAPPADPEQPFDLYVCQRLRDTTPPVPPVITALKAGDGSVKVEWVGPPIQDIKAYYVYRAEAQDGEYGFVGGLVVETETPITSELPVPEDVGCDQIQLKTNEKLGTGAFVDAGANGAVEAKKIYWYRVLGVDQVGNISSVDNAAPVSTFTFTTQKDAAPAITSVTPQADPCALVVDWTPAIDAAEDLGFAVYRSTSPNGPYKQVGGLVAGNQLVDRRIRRGVTYWYRVVRLGVDGKRSATSTVSSGQLP